MRWIFPFSHEKKVMERIDIKSLNLEELTAQLKELGLPVKKNVRLILGTDEECGSSDIAVYYKQEKEAPMTFSPDAEFPVINVEKGRLPGHFAASFEKSDAMPKLVKIDALPILRAM